MTSTLLQKKQGNSFALDFRGSFQAYSSYERLQQTIISHCNGHVAAIKIIDGFLLPPSFPAYQRLASEDELIERYLCGGFLYRLDCCFPGNQYVRSPKRTPVESKQLVPIDGRESLQKAGMDESF